MSDKTWLIAKVPNWPNTKGVTDSLCTHIQFDQEQSPGVSGGTTARKMLTKEEAFAAAKRMAENGKHILNDGYCYVPVQLHAVFRLNPKTTYDFVEESV